MVSGLGYIGSHTCWALTKAGRNVIIIGNLSNSYRSVLDKFEILRKRLHTSQNPVPLLEFYKADYRDESLMRAILSKYQKTSSDSSQARSHMAGVIHIATYKVVAGSFRQPLSYYGINVSGVISFCTVLDEFNIKSLAFSSSAAVYGSHANRGGWPPKDLCVHSVEHFWNGAEGAQQVSSGGCSGLTNPYGRTEWICEVFLQRSGIQ